MNPLKSLFLNKSKIIAYEKSEIRHRIRDRKKMLSENEKIASAKAVFEKIEIMPEFIHAKNVLIYWSLPDELPTHNFVRKWRDQKQFLLPVVKERDMLIKPFTTTDEMKKGSFGIWEPSVQEEFIKKIDLVIVPGVAFDKNKRRLGRGGGYYDKYFENNNILKVGICYDFQVVPEVPDDIHDVQMDKIISPSYYF